MRLRSMRFAVTLSEELHFGRAARRHFISAQSFGREIQRLERELGVVLFVRTSRTVALTSVGERYVRRAQEILAAADELATTVAELPPADGLLVVGVLGFGLAEGWSDLRQELHAQSPEVRLGYRRLDIGSQYGALLRGEVDVAIVQQVGPVDGLRFESMTAMPRVAVVPVWSDLADAERLRAADVDGREWISLAPDAHPSLAAWLGAAAEHSGAASAVRNPADIPVAVATTGALGLHADAAGRFYPHPAVRFVPIDGDPCRIAVASRYGDDRPAVTAFRQAAQATASV